MIRALLGFFVFLTVQSAQYRRLQTQAVTRLKAQDNLISTLGLFRLILKKTGCTMNVQTFDGNQTYILKGNYTSPTVTNDCQYLQLSVGKLTTSSGSQYMKVDGVFSMTTLTIDDNGIILLLGIEKSINTQIIPAQGEFKITKFQTDNPFLKALSNDEIDFSFGGTVTNMHDWKFSVNTAQLEIYKSGNPGIIIAYIFSHLNIKGSGLYDFNDLKMPFSLFPNITFAPRCFQPQKFLDHRAPFTFSADPYWPIFRLYQQGGYVIKQVAYGVLPSFDFPNPERQIHFATFYSPCPDFTFQHKGDCITNCPIPYYSNMIGSKGKCVLTCQQDGIVDEVNKICACSTPYQSSKLNSQFIKSCPSNSLKYPYGCYCTTQGQFFDRQLTFSCVTVCPSATFAQNGLCMRCPSNCKQCQIDGFYRAYLECKVCNPGFKLLNTGKCTLQCNPNYGLIPSDAGCVQCADPACVDCKGNLQVCNKCNPNYALQNGLCVKQCGTDFKQAHMDKVATVCLPKDATCLSMMSANYRNYSFLKCDSCSNTLVSHVEKCLTSCPTGFKQLNKYCVCADSTKVTVGGRCLDLPGCPIKTSLDIRSSSCISCPQGCISCSQNSCTSCSPGYFLRIAPQFVTCFRKSPLTNCQQQFSLQQGVCVVNNYATLDMTLCITSVVNCQVCTRLSRDFCVLCNEGFRLYNNTCISTCPTGLIPYQKVCIVPEISNCQVPHLLTQKFPTLVNRSVLLENKPYSYYIQNQIAPFNVPVGYIPYSQFLIQLEDLRTRNAQLTEISWTCLKCIDGMGLSDNYTQCIPCPLPCSNCYFAKNNSCLTNQNSTNSSTTCLYRDKLTNNCLTSCNDPNIPLLVGGILFCVPPQDAPVKDVARVDSAVYVSSNDYKVTYFIFEDKFQYQGGVMIKSVPSAIKIQKLAKQKSTRVLQNQNQNVPQTVGPGMIQGDFLEVNNTDNDIYILNLTSALVDLRDASGRLFPNPVYGVQVNLSHPQFMRTWLSHIGFIMAWVIIVLHVWFIGNQIMYKVDNLIILAQSLYYFSFVKLLVGRLLAQFYYGWIWAHVGWFPNYFARIIPDGYHQRNAPNSYKLATLDANVLRNAGFSLSLLLTFFVAALIIIFLVYVISQLTRRHQIWYPKVAKFSLIAAFQFFSMNIMYWSVACLLYNYVVQSQDQGYHNTSIVLSIIFISVISVYTIGRFFFDILGGIYMAKRILVAVILAGAVLEKLYFLAILIGMELVFVVARWVLESPDTIREKFYLLIEELLIMACYILAFLSINAGVNTIIISIIIFIFIVFLANDLTEVYLQSQNQWLIEDDDLEKGSPQKVVAAEKVQPYE